MSDAVKRVSAEISGSEISGSRDFQADSALASARASGNQLGRPRFARRAGRPGHDSRPISRRLRSWRRAGPAKHAQDTCIVPIAVVALLELRGRVAALRPPVYRVCRNVRRASGDRAVWLESRVWRAR